jgi:hypothetical protein
MNWGPAFWRCIHYMAIHKNKDVIDILPLHIPCDDCKAEWIYPEVDEDLVDWSLRLHNKVNAKLGKWDKWDRTDFNISHKPTCDICEGHEHRYLFPWMLMYTLAESQEFIMDFVSKYPCPLCRGQLVVDLPGPDETHIDWVHRNHIRFNQERGLPVPPPLHSDNVEGVSSTGNCASC